MTWDAIVVGSGFGGSVAALRLAEAGRSVLLLEKGRRFEPDDFPETNWQLRRWLWAPRVGCRGPFRMTVLRHLTALSGVGVGGGSLVYANTLARPDPAFFLAPSWADLADWEAELAPHYDTAGRMLGAAPCPGDSDADAVIAAVARDAGPGFRHDPVDVGVFYGTPGETVPDPYFGGEGPDRTGCVGCGGCMLGCRFGAKNTLDRNYLWLAERRRMELRPEHEVVWIRPVGTEPAGGPGGDGPGNPDLDGVPPASEASASDGARYEVEALAGRAGWFGRRARVRFRAREVVLAGGVLGTVSLLAKLRRSEDGLPRLSPRVGDFVRTNSEVLVGVVGNRRDLDMSKGVAITSVVHTPEGATLEPVRYSAGSGAFRLITTPLAPGDSPSRRLAAAFARVGRSPGAFLRAVTARDHARRTLILLYMRTGEGHLSLDLDRGGRLRTRLSDGPAPTASFYEATEFAERVAEELDGFPGSLATEALLGTPTTAHILGGAVMGRGPDDGVIDTRHRVFGYPGLRVVDGSAVSANPGVNPALTITALAERAMAMT